MAEPSFAEQMSTLNSTLGAIEVRLALGRAPVEGLEDFKSALDDMRLRLWGLLECGGWRRLQRVPGAVPDPPRDGDVPRRWVTICRRARSVDRHRELAACGRRRPSWRRKSSRHSGTPTSVP